MYQQGAAMQRQIIQQQGTPVAPRAQRTAPNMSFGTTNGPSRRRASTLVHRVGGEFKLD
jgi:hypothetical protein